MIVRFNSLNRTERPVLTLCNPGSTYDNGKLTNVVGILTNHEAEENVFNFNSSSELNFRLNKVTTGDDEADEYMGFLYDAVKNKRLIFIDDIGFFLINNVQEQYDNLNTFKDVTAKSIDIELQQRNIPFIPDGTYRFLDGDGKSGILNMIVDTLPYWTIGTVDSSVASKYRTFEDVDTSLNCLGFMIDNLQDAYECIILFDTINRTINVYDQNNYIHQTDIHISKKDIINMSKVSESSDDLYTAITVSGDSDVLISAINPLGTNTLYNFSYYLDWMSAPLKEKVIAWNAKISSHEADYYNLNLDYYNKEKQAHDIELEINRLETQLSMYERCRDNIVANNDTDYVVSYNEAISASGGTVITIKPEISQTLAEIDRLIGICRTNMSNAQTQLSAINAQIEAIADEINTIRSDVSFTNNFTNDELSELNNYVFEGTYKDEYVVITDIMDYAEQFSQMKILYDRARAQLLRISQPTQEFEIDVENFLFEREFAHASDQLETGCLINVELNDNDIAELFLSSIKVNYDDHNLSLTFGNRYNKFDPKTLFDNVLGSVSKSANTLGYVKDLLYPIKAGELNAIKNQLQSARDLSMIGALTSDNEEVVIDSSGYTGRKKLSDGIYDPKQIKITNNNIVFTKDGWETSSLAIGDIILPDESSVYGVNAQALIGDIIIGTELHIKDSQGRDLLTVIDGRISTEVSEVKSAAASGTFEYYDPSNLSWTEQGNVDYFGYGLSQDGTETDTGVKAAGNNNKYFLNKHNGNLYKSNGTKWVFQKTLSPRFNNYSTIAYTDNKASTAESNAKTYAEVKASAAESNAITNATNQVSTAKATIASSTVKYDETGITVNYYGYGAPTEIAGATQGKIYLDQNEGYYYTKGSGSNWTKSSSALPLYADQKANTAKSEAISAASADATQKANQAEENAITDATNQVNNATTTIANAVSKYDTTGLTISYYGYGTPDISTATANQKYLDQNTGFVYTKNSGSGWTKSTSALTLITTKVATDAANDATTKANNAISTAATDATTKANTAENNAKTAAANAMSKYDEGSLTINYYGFGVPTTVAGSSQGEIYLDQNTGYYYTKGSGSTWTKSTNALPLYADQKATEAYNNALSYVSTYYITSEDASTTINQTKQEIEMKAAKAVNKYEIPVGITINFAGYGTPAVQGVKATAANQYYLDQETGNLYKSDSNKNWSPTPVQSLTIITDNLDSKITQNANQIQLKVSAGDVCSVISQSSDTITLSSGRLIINSGNFQLDLNGNATLAGGVIRSANYVADTSGTEIDLSNGVIDSKNFKLDSNGRMTASAGSFGGWEIGSEDIGGTWDYYIESTKNQYGSIRWHSIHYRDIPSGTDPFSITALDIKDKEGEVLFRVAMDGSISTATYLGAHEASFEHASLGEYGYTGEEHLELRTGDFDGSGGYPPSYIKFKDASQNERLSLFTGRIRLSNYDTNGKIITQSRIDSTEMSIVQNNSDETEKYKSTLTPLSLNFIDHTNQSSLGIKFNNVLAFYWYNNAVQCGISNKPLKLLGSAITANGSPIATSSDERIKRDITSIDSRYINLVKKLEPKAFKYKEGVSQSDRVHTGYIAQELKNTMDKVNLTTQELAAFVDIYMDHNEYAIRYEELIPLLHAWLRELDGRLSIIEKERKIRNE